MNSDTHKKRIIFYLILSSPFMIFDNIVCAKLEQYVWDCIFPNLSSLLLWGLLFIGYYLLFRSMICLFYWSETQFIKQSSNFLKESIYSYYLKHPDLSASQKKISSIINNDIPLLEEDYYRSCVQFIVCMLEAAFAFIITLSENPYYGMFYFLIMIIPILFSKRNVTSIASSNKALQESKKEYTNFLSKIISGKETIQIYHLFEKIFEDHTILARKITTSNIDKNTALNQIAIYNQNRNRCFSSIATLVGFYLVYKGKLTFGWVMALTQLSSSMTYTLVDAIQYGIKIHSIHPLKKEIFTEYKISSKQDTKQIQPSVDETSISEISANKPSVNEAFYSPYKIGLDCCIHNYSIHDKTILENIMFSLNPGEKLLISGNNGAGKTTLLKIILGIYSNYNGHIKWFDSMNQELSDCSDYIAYIPQKPFLFMDSVKHNILLDSPESQEKYNFTKNLVCLHLEDTKNVSTIYSNISGGEAQKIELARAIYSDRTIFILDEPYSALDQDSLDKIQSFLLSDKTKTVITISHIIQPSILSLYDKHLILENGKQVSFSIL